LYPYAQEDTFSASANKLFCALAFLLRNDVKFYYVRRIVSLPIWRGGVPSFSDVHLMYEETI